MPVQPDAPLRRVTINLYEADVREAEARFGYGWSVRLRDEWHRFLALHHAPTTEQLDELQFGRVLHKRTLGDLDDTR
jgi:hypothetical protein